MTAAIEVNRLQKRFGALTVTDNVSFKLAAGARHALIGPNGAGKTTLVGLLSGQLMPDAGRVLLRGRDVTAAPPERRVKLGLARTFQINNLFRDFTVLENVFLAVSERTGKSWNPWRRADQCRDALLTAQQAIEALGLQDDTQRRVGELPYGRQRLVEIAIALSLSPKVLLLDEPVAGVPGSDVGRILDTIDRLPPDIAILLIEHDMQVVRRFATEVTVLVAGRILMSGVPQDVMASPQVHALYLGRPHA